MLVNLVSVQVKKETIDEFVKVSLENARESRKEPGIARFDIIRETGDPARFVFVEVFTSEDATLKHKETAHYKKWKTEVQDMMAEERTTLKCTSLWPPDGEW